LGTRSRPPLAQAPEELRSLEDVSRAHVEHVLEICGGNQTNAARALGINRKTLSRKMREWGLAMPSVPRELARGSLIAIEGLDGAGITTQAKRLVEFLNARDHATILTSEPSDGPIGRFLREALVDTSSLARGALIRTLSLLFAADRVDHYHRVVVPALASGTTVVSDRWYHSSLAYQRTGVEREWIATLNRHTRTPDFAVYLEITPETGLARRARAGRTPELFHDLETQRDVFAGYRATISELRMAGERIVVVDANQGEEAVFAAILRGLGLVSARRSRG
jgi:dTMP kinase